MTETQDTDVLYKGLPQHFGQIVTYLSSGLELMKSVGSSERLSLLFMIKGMVWHFMSDAHKVTTALILMLPLLCCRGVSLQSINMVKIPILHSPSLFTMVLGRRGRHTFSLNDLKT